jgi:hypothetical protein
MHMSIAVQRALQRKSDLEKELQEIETFLALYQRYGGVDDASSRAAGEGLDHGFDDGKAAKPSARAGVKSASRKAKSRRRPSGNGSGRKSFVENCVDLLVQTGHPMTGRELWTMFNETGLKAGKRNDLNNFAVKLSQARGRFVNIKGAGYWPASVPCPAVGYEPTTSASVASAPDNSANG